MYTVPLYKGFHGFEVQIPRRLLGKDGALLPLRTERRTQRARRESTVAVEFELGVRRECGTRGGIVLLLKYSLQ